MKKIKILVTGGAGYIGSVLIPELLKNGYEVTLYDILMYESHQLIPFFTDPNFRFIKGNILEKDKLKKAIEGMDIVIHLAAIVGYGACRMDEARAYLINHIGTKNVIECMSPEQYLLFGSTGSNYGSVDGICTETTPLHPLSIYGKSKTMAEEEVLKRPNSTAFRFATAFGSSPRLRLDLLINELTYLAKFQKYLVIYESHFMRTFIHVRDIARVFIFAMNNMSVMRDNVYNVGSNTMNFSKKEICEKIKAQAECYVHYADYDGDVDKRNYIVSYEKLNKLGFDTTITVDQGITELLNTMDVLQIKIPFKNS